MKKEEIFSKSKSEIRQISSIYQLLMRQVEWTDYGRSSSISRSLTKKIEKDKLLIK